MGNKIDVSTNNNIALAKVSRMNVLVAQVSKTIAEQNELVASQSELSDYIITSSDYNAIAQASDVVLTDNKIGVLSALTTSDKSSLVSAASEVNQKVSANAQITSLRHEISLLKMISSVKNRVDGATGIMFDDMSGLNAASVGIIDLTKTNTTSGLNIGSVTIPVLSVSGLAIGKEVTIFDDVNLERRVITGISGLNLTVSALVYSYKNQAQVCRSSVVQDTVNKLLKFGGWNYQTTYINTNVSVVNSDYDTSGNGGRKIVYLSNGWIVNVVYDSSGVFRFYKSTDNGATDTQLCFFTSGAATFSWAITNVGTNIYFICDSSAATGVSFRKFDAATITNIEIPTAGIPVGIMTGQTSMGAGCSIAASPNGTLTATASSKNATYPNSNNIISAKSVDGGVTWTKQDGTAGVDQITPQNTTGVDYTNPCIVVKANNNPVIICQYLNGVYYIQRIVYTGTAWQESTVFSTGTYAQSNTCTIVKQYGTNIGRIWLLCDGLDSTDTTKRNVKADWSDDGGTTWNTVFKITSGNTIDRQKPTIAENTNGDIYVTYMDGASISYQVCANGTTTFSGVTTFPSSGTNPSSIERLGLAFTVPPTIYMSGSSVKFDGTWINGGISPVLVEDIRYNINPSSNITSSVSWIQHETDANYSITGALSLQASGGNESYSNMTKSTVAVDGSHSEDQFSTSLSSNQKGTLRYTLTRSSTSLVKNISQITGAVS